MKHGWSRKELEEALEIVSKEPVPITTKNDLSPVALRRLRSELPI